MSCIPALSDGGDKYCLIVVVLDFLSCPIHTELLQRVDLLGEEKEMGEGGGRRREREGGGEGEGRGRGEEGKEEEEEEYSRDHMTQ